MQHLHCSAVVPPQLSLDRIIVISSYPFSPSSIVYSFHSSQKDILHESIPSYSEQRSKPLSWFEGPKYCDLHGDLISYHPCSPSFSCSILFYSSNLPAHSHCSLATWCSLIFYFINYSKPCTVMIATLISQMRKWEWRIQKVLPKSVQLSLSQMALCGLPWWLRQ